MLRFILLFVILLIVNSLDLPNNLNDLNRLLVTKSREFNILDDELLKMEKERETIRNSFNMFRGNNIMSIQKIIYLNNKIENLKRDRHDLNHLLLLIEGEVRKYD
jgi:hypothetical protein|tara:strand:+ start:505 stop:819 length:315 start_codon:yes stop_codon:yes gene_type:complete